jgi:alpha-mannosidase
MKIIAEETDISGIFYRAKEHPMLNLPMNKGFIILEDPENKIRLSAIKQKEKGEGLLVRGYNITSEEATFLLHFNLQVKSFYRLDLRERRMEQIITKENNCVTLTAAPGEIITIEAIL